MTINAEHVEVPMAPENCEHAWKYVHEPGHLIYWVKQCMLCHDVDWHDLDSQIAELIEARK